MPSYSPSADGRFIRHTDALFMPCLDSLPLHRICFEPTAFRPQCFAEQGMALPGELQSAVAKRQGEFLAGRLAARLALRPYGLGEERVAIGQDRAPCWPAGMEGSISHSRLLGQGMALCAVRPGRAGLGLDLEAWLDARQADQLWPGIVDKEEWGRLATGAAAADLSLAEGLTLVFSAKESLFKALYPRVGRYFDFLDASWSAMGAQTLRLSLKTALAPDLPAGWHCTLRWQRLPGGLLTLLAL
ncbi:4'-phosphopantetheinyl transferase superfamily protein [Aeromonas sp. MR16]|uniref:4'-phosphopantetheinyl transferase family protein n=1 Tax=Aeromonas sp. MR16 TaxID=2923420 RepID=UPI001F4AE4F7|nr:4'-phosphopantetheinyl transferase superfamily protein [Aeromonas sp. MR16]MCH7369692.1 4'-phosphopantetheinyl transferase superfamily protein [Aeromonas sp. MR16]